MPTWFVMQYSKKGIGQFQTCRTTENAVALQLNKYLLHSNFTESRQSAYRTGQSTETALNPVKNYILIHQMYLTHLSMMFSLVG